MKSERKKRFTLLTPHGAARGINGLGKRAENRSWAAIFRDKLRIPSILLMEWWGVDWSGAFSGQNRGRSRRDSAQTDLAQDALAGEQLGAQADHEAKHGQPAIPGFGKGDESVTGGGVGHRYCDL